ncbi:hypothetical protein E1264_03755 [Actinomadura sp. KC216]|uniref:hypothetical protein n=1 Tax=Actinomadura sp. KC216 TaxID=2530370 RepID=UPI001043EB35|nr:hypothetical protein [Actinomadura sp. KC216]TDB90931.1 hypothetical protein E1264_03755 [Actinomadura sp. KC216]
MFEQVTLEQLMELASRAGKEVARKYPGVEAEDIASEALSSLMEKLDRVAEMAPGYLYEVLRRGGLTYAAAQRYQYIVESSQYVYTPKEVRALLEHCYYDPAAWDVPTGEDDWLSAEIDGQSIGVALIDIKVAMKAISPAHRNALECRFYKGDTSVERKLISRAIDSLVRALNRKINGFEGDFEGRRSMSNGEAQRRISYEMEQDSSYRSDALDEYHDIRSATAVARDFQDPPGTWFDWSKYTQKEAA